MNYERIYSEFIADRLTNQPVKPTYFEKHHIIPRSVGGGNEAPNLIRLTPEDHLFAHLLLAKVHGGALWAAIFLMSGTRGYGRNRGRPRATRKLRAAYGLAKRAWSEFERGKDGLKGADNGNYNPVVYKWVNLDTGEKVSATLHEMWARYGGGRGTWTSAITAGSGKPSACGWALDDGTERLRSSKGKEFVFVNRDGRRFTGSQKSFCDFIGTSYGAGTRLVRHKGVTVCGWRLYGTDDRSHLDTKNTGHAARLNSGVSHIFEKDGVTFSGKVSDLATHFDSTKQQVHAGIQQVKMGRMRSYKGWAYIGVGA